MILEHIRGKKSTLINKTAVIGISILFILVVSTPAINRIKNDRYNLLDSAHWMQGYSRALRGGTINYHSPEPDINTALLVRSMDAEDYIEWETESVPNDLKQDNIAFIWIFGMDVDSDPCSYNLYVNNEKWFRFSNPTNIPSKQWTLEGPSGSELCFRTTFIDRHGDIFGYASLYIPAPDQFRGNPLRIKVKGESAGSRVWYMTFKSPVHSGARINPLPALIKYKNNTFQPVDVFYTCLGDNIPAEFSSPDVESVKTRLSFGFNRITMFFPEATGFTESVLSIKFENGRKETAAFARAPVRKWTVYLVQHTHTDIGYTRPQTDILPEHLRFIDYALDYCDQTDDYPDDARFRWTCEAAWPVHAYFTRRPLEQIRRLEHRILEERIELTALPFNLSEIADENLLADSLQFLKIFRSRELPLSTAMQNDVNGIAWCFAEYFPDVNIRYLIMGQHGHRARIPFDKPTPFWWESPSGKRVLAFRADHYNTGNFWGIHNGIFEASEKEVMKYLSSLEIKDYPFDRISVQYSGYFTDNSPPSTIVCDFIKEWNEKYIWPKLRSATAGEFMNYIDSHHAKNLPVFRTAWPDWWSDGFGSTSRETAAARQTQSELMANQTLLSMASFLGTSIPKSVESKIDKIRQALLFWDEHTMGAAESISDPLSENSMIQWAEKSSYVWEAFKENRLLQETALGLLQGHIPRNNKPSIAVFNTLNWGRSGLTEVYIDHEILPPNQAFRIMDCNGTEIAAQPSRSRADGTYWFIWAENIPALGYSVYQIEKLDSTNSPILVQEYQNTGLENDYYRIDIDPDTGTISGLYDKEMKRNLIDTNCSWTMGEFIHETISNRSQLEQFQLINYARKKLKDIKIEKIIIGHIWKSVCASGYTETAANTKRLQWEIRLYNKEKRIEILYTIVKKGITDPEALYVAFPFNLPGACTFYESHGGEVIPGKNQLEGTSADWHTIQSYAAVKSPVGQIILVSDEVPLMQFGDLNLGKFQYIAEVKKPHMYSWVMNNYWVTNFRASQEGEFKWKYFLTSAPDPSRKIPTFFGWGSRVPLSTRVFPPGKTRTGPLRQSLLQILPDNILLVSLKTIPNEDGFLMQIREIAGKPSEISVTRGEKKLTIIEANVLGEPIGKTGHSLPIPAFGTKFLLLNDLRYIDERIDD
jgi:alpha-mannosidase